MAKLRTEYSLIWDEDSFKYQAELVFYNEGSSIVPRDIFDVIDAFGNEGVSPGKGRFYRMFIKNKNLDDLKKDVEKTINDVKNLVKTKVLQVTKDQMLDIEYKRKLDQLPRPHEIEIT